MGEARRRKPPETNDRARWMAATLTAILARYREHRREQERQARERPHEPLEIIDAAWKIEDIPPRWMDGGKEVADDPVRFWLKSAARDVGWRAYAEGGLALMHRVSDLAQDAGASGEIIDKWWDNIGGPNDTWWS